VKRKSAPTFDAFCREAVDFLTGASTPYLIIGGLAVAVIGEPRMTGDVDVIGYLSVEHLASLPFEDDARARARKRRLFGRLVPLPTPEDLILFKVLAGRDKDLVDAVGVARRHLSALDHRYLDATLNAICELAEDLAPRSRLDEVLRKASGHPSKR
jgi:hypothetical protein